MMNENEIARIVVDEAYHIHRKIGPGLLECVYEELLLQRLQKRSLQVERQVSFPLQFEDIRIANALRIDLIVGGLVIVELKSTTEILDIHRRQLLTYLKVSGLKLGLLFNFNEILLKNGICRLVNGLVD